jgi:hypothetical protein
VLPIFGQSMIIWHMANLPVGVSTVTSIVQYVWKTLMHSGWSTAEKSAFLIIIEGSFHQITLLGVSDGHF